MLLLSWDEKSLKLKIIFSWLSSIFFIYNSYNFLRYSELLWKVYSILLIIISFLICFIEVSRFEFKISIWRALCPTNINKKAKTKLFGGAGIILAAGAVIILK